MKNLTVSLKDKSYDIIIENGILEKVGKEVKDIYNGNKICVVTDENVYKLYGKRIKKSLELEGFDVYFIVVKPGECSKSFEILNEVYNEFIEFKLTRGDLVIAFGGGVVGDLAGFAASTYLRGISYIQIPTSLLAQIDSSIGGKVAVNLPQGKNLVGSFYHPKKVIIDPKVLETLSNRFLKDGLGEVIKYACIKDKELFEMLNNIKSEDELNSNMSNIIYTCCNIKREIVEKDEKDLGLRMILNFGHTFGHGIEKFFNYEGYSHGEAVALGMYYITNKSELLGFTEKGTSQKVKNILENFNIDYNIPDVSMDKIKDTITLDKKNIGSFINLILLKRIGEAYIEKISSNDINIFFSIE
ncbi:3-dehydroquinate synthase [Hathewaya limosa]|uniref:3-dehydroquinate synthase n=1 Tax=Hathewaya limosa TaxID=1536 RepID=A0ABU0JTP2_HATLI|nr:3-dehydroquinate synthase [Hathewaya limosa]MDQ0480469.1 3-dehydroquinate synthase [Hathewaya limosa]